MGTSIRDIKDAGADIWGSGSLTNALIKTEERLQNVFATAHDSGTMRKQMDLVQQVMGGLIDPRQLSMNLVGIYALKISQEMRNIKDKQARDTRMLLAMLDDLDRIADKIDAHNDNIAKGLAALKETYGEDYVQVVAGSILTDEEIATCKTEDELLVLMAEKAFDDNGNLKSGFEHLDPQMIEVLRDVHEREELKVEGAQIINDYKANGYKTTPEIEEHIQTFGADVSIEARTDLESQAGKNEVTEAIYEARLKELGNNSSGAF